MISSRGDCSTATATRSLKSPPTFVVNYPRPGKFIVRVGKVSSSGLLRVWVDDQQQVEKELPCGKGLGKESVWRELRGSSGRPPTTRTWLSRFRLGNTAFASTTRARTGSKRLVTRSPAAACWTGRTCWFCGMKADDLAILWVQNKESCWHNHAAGTVGKVDAFALVAEGLRDGEYRIEWWETWKGTLHRHEEARVQDGKLRLEFPGLKERNIAIKIKAVHQ